MWNRRCCYQCHLYSPLRHYLAPLLRGNCVWHIQLDQRTRAEEEFTSLKQQQLEQRLGRAQCRCAALVALCEVRHVAGIRDDLILPPPEIIGSLGKDGSLPNAVKSNSAPSQDSEAALTALLLGLGEATPSAAPLDSGEASGQEVESSGAGGCTTAELTPNGESFEAAGGEPQAVVATLDLYNVRALANEVLIGNSSNAAYLANVCVAEQARRRGAGSALLEAARQLAREWGAFDVLLQPR